MRRALISTVAIGCAATVGRPALAAAPVDNGRVAAVSVTVSLPGGDTLNLDIHAAQLSAGPQLSIEAQRCNDAQGCVSQDAYLSPLAADALSIDPSSSVADLHATLAGRDLDIAWQPAEGSNGSTGAFDINGTSAATWNYVGGSAAATVQYDGSTCTGSGVIGQEVDASVGLGGDNATSPVSDLTLPSDALLGCTG